MFSAASKLWFTVGFLVVVAAAVVVAFTGDRSAFLLLLASGLALAALGGLAYAYMQPDPLEVVELDSTRTEARPADTTDVARPAPWPMLFAMALGVVAIGAALGKTVLLLGSVLALAAGFVWLSQVWREHPSWTQAMTDRLNNRFVVPIGLPGTILVLAGIGVYSFSRILLALAGEGAVIVAGVTAVVLLVAFAVIATKPNAGRRALGALAAGAAILLVGSGIASAMNTPEHHVEDAPHSESDTSSTTTTTRS